jgi:hypothetical protein
MGSFIHRAFKALRKEKAMGGKAAALRSDEVEEEVGAR